MKCIKHPSSGLLVALVLVTCLSPAAAAQTDAKPKVMRLTPVDRYELDFSGSQGGGIPGGHFNNFAFTLDQGESMRKISVARNEQRKDVIASFDYADCTKGQESLLERQLRDLAPGQAMWVDYVDVEMSSEAQKDLTWAGGVCYGYRNPSGAWHWRLATTPLRYDAATGRVRARIWVKEGNIDALKLVFDYSVPLQPVAKVTLSTRSTKATSDQ